MPKPWFRLYRGLVDNAKAQSLRPDLFKAWINILCCTDDDGNISSLKDLAFKLRKSEAVVSKWFSELSDLGFIVDNKAHDWNEHQFHSDVSTDRVKRFRQRSKKRSRNAERNAPDTDTDTDTEYTQATPERLAVAKPTPLDVKKSLFSTGVAFLNSAGVNEPQARKLLGMWRKSHGDLAVINALAAAEGAAVSDPVPYITKALKESPRGQSTPSVVESVTSLLRLADAPDPDDQVF